MLCFQKRNLWKIDNRELWEWERPELAQIARVQLLLLCWPPKTVSLREITHKEVRCPCSQTQKVTRKHSPPLQSRSLGFWRRERLLMTSTAPGPGPLPLCIFSGSFCLMKELFLLTTGDRRDNSWPQLCCMDWNVTGVAGKWQDSGASTCTL